MFSPALFAASRKTPKQEAEIARRKMADDFATMLDKMSAAERRRFWEQHDADTSADEQPPSNTAPQFRPPPGYTSGA